MDRSELFRLVKNDPYYENTEGGVYLPSDKLYGQHKNKLNLRYLPQNKLAEPNLGQLGIEDLGEASPQEILESMFGEKPIPEGYHGPASIQEISNSLDYNYGNTEAKLYGQNHYDAFEDLLKEEALAQENAMEEFGYDQTPRILVPEKNGRKRMVRLHRANLDSAMNMPFGDKPAPYVPTLDDVWNDFINGSNVYTNKEEFAELLKDDAIRKRLMEDYDYNPSKKARIIQFPNAQNVGWQNPKRNMGNVYNDYFGKVIDPFEISLYEPYVFESMLDYQEPQQPTLTKLEKPVIKKPITEPTMRTLTKESHVNPNNNYNGAFGKGLATIAVSIGLNGLYNYMSDKEQQTNDYYYNPEIEEWVPRR